MSKRHLKGWFWLMDEKYIEKRNIKLMTLYFPNGATTKECDDIAYHGQKYSNSKISQGGLKPLDQDFTEFSEEEMIYEFGYLK